MTGRMMLQLLLLLITGGSTYASINWGKLVNPVLQYSNWSIKDDFVQYHPEQELYFVFFSAFYEDAGQIRSHVVEVSTADFITFSDPILNFYGKAQGMVGMCSPSITVYNTTAGIVYYLTFNSWGMDPNDQMFYMYSGDMQSWSPIFPLAQELSKGMDAIDSCIGIDTEYSEGDSGTFYLIFKNDNKHIPMLAKSVVGITQNYSLINGNGAITLLLANGSASTWIHENYQFIQLHNVWYLLCTDYPGNPHLPFLYTMTTPGDWTHWSKGYELVVEVQKGFNTDNIANAAALAYWGDGYVYISYAGNIETQTYLGRGWNRLGLSRSSDLLNWEPAGSSG